MHVHKIQPRRHKKEREMKYVPPVIFKTLDLSLENATRLPESFA